MELILDGQSPQPASSGGAASDLIKDVTVETFAEDVIEASMQTPVLVDFWATWCGPCKSLTPTLEKVVKMAAGAVKLVKVDIDDPMNRDLVGQLRIQSVPTVYAFVGGRPVDAFQGAQPESEIKAFCERLVGGPLENPVDALMAAAEAALADNNPGEAFEAYQQVLGREPENGAAWGGYIRTLLAMEEVEGARQVVDGLEPALKSHADVVNAISALELAEQTAGGADTAEFDAKLAANEDDHQARFDRAMARFAANDRDGAVEDLVEIIRRDRTWNDDGARAQLLKFFEAWGPMDPASVAGRRRLSTVLFS